jgi:uncharacterized repeat protein (TIGR01451 family)
MFDHRGALVPALALLVAVGLLAGVAPAWGQAPFTPAMPWWTGPGGTLGVGTDGVTLFYDMDGNGSTIDPWDTSYPLPDSAVGANLRLTPTRQVLYVFKPGCGGTVVFFYRIPPVDGDPLPIIAGPICIPNGIAHEGFFYTGATSARWAYIADQVPPAGTTQQIYWVDLNTGSNASTQFALNENIGTVEFDSLGIVAFVQHATGDGDNLADYSLVELCPGSIGTLLNPGGGGLFGLGPDLAKAFLVDNAGSWEARIEHPPGIFLTQFALNDCSTPPSLGACCLAIGGCADGVSEADCLAGGGTWNGAGSDCGTAGCPPPPVVIPEISKVGPVTARQGDHITYTIDYGNSGNADADSAVIGDVVPSGTSFVSATGGGVYNPITKRMSWSTGPLPASSGGSVSMTVQVLCNISTVTNSNYWITAYPGGQVFGSAVITSVSPALTDSVQVAVSSVPQSPEPLDTGDLIEHTITLTNTIAETRYSLSFNVQYGFVSDFGSLIQNGGGTVQTFPSSMTWTGDLGPSATVDIVFTTQIEECRSQLELSEHLNRGNPIQVKGTCGLNVIGLGAVPGPFAVKPPPIAVSITSTNLNPPQVLPNTNRRDLVTLVRPGGAVELEGKIVNNLAVPSPSVSADFVIPSSMTPDGNPPYIGTPPAGTSYDMGSQTITWAGTIAANDSIQIAFRALADSGGACISDIGFLGSYGSCVDVDAGTIYTIEVPPPPVESHLLGTSSMLGVWTYRPGVDTAPQILFCADPNVFEGFWGLDRDDNGNIWLTGPNNFWFNPTTLDFKMFPGSFAAQHDMDLINDVVLDPSDNTVIYVGSKMNGGSNELVTSRFDPVTEIITPILSGTALPPFVQSGHGALDPEGHLATNVLAGVNRIDLSSPGGSPVYSDAVITQPFSLCLDTDGDYLVTDEIYGTATAQPLVKIDRLSGTFTTLFADLNSIFPWDQPFAGSTVGPDGTIYFAPVAGPLAMIERDTGFVATPLSGFGLFYQHFDVMFVNTGTVAVPRQEVPKTTAVLQLLPAQPNPFTSRTTIRYALPRQGHVRLSIFDLRGRRVAELVNGEQSPGPHHLLWEGSDRSGRALSSGIYFLRLEMEGEVLRRKVVLMR